MLIDTHYSTKPFALSQIEHRYGEKVHLLNDPFLFSMLADLGNPDCQQPSLNERLRILYLGLLQAVVSNTFPKAPHLHTSRMATLHPQGKFQATTLSKDTRVVCVDLARAGTVPSQVCFDILNNLLNPQGIRQDHISINRKVDENNRVVGTHLGGLKIGGRVDGTFVLIPDPMGATGSTLKSALEIYQQYGTPHKFIALHLIVTPEYLATVTKAFPNLEIYAIRLDRGLSPNEVLSTIPGTKWSQEKGLNEKQYIVPGAGGLGEVINNSYV